MIKIKLGNSQYTKLSVFDFDGTLFKSPDKPEGYKGNWWIEKKSLESPAVPDHPDENFWNNDVVEQARNELNNKTTCCILMTGRVGNVFHERINDLINQQNLDFYFIKCNSFGEDTAQFKIKEIKNILKKYKTIKDIEIWDDESDKIYLYQQEFSDGYNFKSNLIGE